MAKIENMENIFEKVKAAVSVLEAATRYGLHPDGSEMCKCIFHSDQHPSMKLNKDYFHCFGCGKSGDVISLTAEILHLSNYDAAKKLAADFGPNEIIRSGSADSSEKEFAKRAKPSSYHHDAEALTAKLEETIRRAEAENLLNWIQHATDILSRYHLLLQKWETEYSPKSAAEEWRPLFVEAMRQQPFIEYLLTLLDERDEFTNREFYRNYNEEVNTIEERIEQYSHDGNHAHDGRAA